MNSPHEPQEPSPGCDCQGHLEAGEVQGGRPIVIGPLDVLSLGIAAGLDVIDELVWGGPQVLGRKRDRHV